MKWQYKVISADELFSGNGDHDIAVSKDAAQARRKKMGKNIEDTLNGFGSEGWELVNIFGEIGILKKQID